MGLEGDSPIRIDLGRAEEAGRGAEVAVDEPALPASTPPALLPADVREVALFFVSLVRIWAVEGGASAET